VNDLKVDLQRGCSRKNVSTQPDKWLFIWQVRGVDDYARHCTGTIDIHRADANGVRSGMKQSMRKGKCIGVLLIYAISIEIPGQAELLTCIVSIGGHGFQ